MKRRGPQAKPPALAEAKRGKVKPSLGSAPAMPAAKKKGAPLLTAPTPAAAAAAGNPPPYDWKQDRDLKAFACLLAYDSGWLQEPAQVTWTFEENTKIVEVTRPEGSVDIHVAARARFDRSLEVSLGEIQHRWGDVWADKVRDFAAPVIKPAPLLGQHAWYLRDLARRTANDVPFDPSSDSRVDRKDIAAAVEAALVELARRCADAARNCNLGDPSMSAQTTRNMAAGAILEMLNPPKGKTA